MRGGRIWVPRLIGAIGLFARGYDERVNGPDWTCLNPMPSPISRQATMAQVRERQSHYPIVMHDTPDKRRSFRAAQFSFHHR